MSDGETQQFRSVSIDTEESVDSPTPIRGEYDWVGAIAKKLYDDLNDELEEPLVDPVPVKFIKSGINLTVRIRHSGNKFIDLKINKELLMDFNECLENDPMEID